MPERWPPAAATLQPVVAAHLQEAFPDIEVRPIAGMVTQDEPFHTWVVASSPL